MVSVVPFPVRVSVVVPTVATTFPLGLNCNVASALSVTAELEKLEVAVKGIVPPTLE
jgi:hypothetical protein